MPKTKKRKRTKAKKEIRVAGSVGGAMKAVDGSLKGDSKGDVKAPIQTGFVEPPLVMHKPIEVEPEELTPNQQIEKRVLLRIIRKLIPAFPVKKLEKQRLEDLWYYFEEELPEFLQEEILIHYKDKSP